MSGNLDPHLCDECRFMLTTSQGLSALRSDEGCKHTTLGALKSREKPLCGLCELLFGELMSDESLGYAASLHLRVEGGFLESSVAVANELVFVGHPFGGSALVYIQGTVPAADGGGVHSGRALWASTDSTNPAAILVANRPSLSDFASDEATLAIKEQLQVCQGIAPQAHQHCRPYVPTRLPTRLIDVMGGQDSEHVRLFTPEPDDLGQYITLSYCWGGPQTAILTQSTLDAKLRSISIQILPQTIADAIQMTRNLGFQYLWVDSLCIIQDSSQDLALEIPAMCAIYEKAALNIAASSARAATDGFLEPRKTPRRVSVPINVSINESGIVYFATQEIYAPNRILDLRAWAFQESLLSHRQVIFSDREILWRCYEGGLRSLRESHLVCMDEYAIKLWLHRSINGSPYDWNIIGNRFLAWKDIVEEYTRRKVTFDKDRLCALAGIISKLRGVFDDVCFFGLWRKDFIAELAWYSPPPWQCLPDSEVRTPLPFIAPGWSWASVTGEVVFELMDKIVAEVKHLPSIEVRWDQYEDRVQGRVTLSAPILPNPKLVPTKTAWDIFDKDIFDFPTSSAIPSENLVYLILICQEGSMWSYFEENWDTRDI